jgi:hypothetical protein
MTADESRARARRSPIWWFGVFGRILDKAKKLVRPKPNIFQVRMAMAYEWARSMGIAILIIGVKPRQVGGTTISAAIGYHHMRVFPTDAVAIGDIIDRSEKLFQMYKRFRENDALDWGQQDQPGTNDLLNIGRSKLEKKTAENPTASRASTLQFIHKSEVAFWPQGGARDAVETDTALMGSLAKHKDTLCIDESTPKGSSGLFANRWLSAKWPVYDDYWKKYAKKQEDGESAWIRVFAAWFEFEEYQREVTQEEAARIQSTLTAREKTGIQAYDWTVQQVAWRRYTILNECSNSEIKFDEEYPEDPVTCFQASGSPRFDGAGLNYLQSLAEWMPYKSGMLSDIDPVRGGRPTFIPTKDEVWVKLWELPKVGCRYFIAGDVAEDKDMNPAKASIEVKRDRHSFFVLRAGFADDRNVRWRPRVVGRIVTPCRWGHDLLAKRLYLLSVFFGGCPIAPEMNNHGLALAKELKRLTANLFSQTIIDPLDQTTRKIYGHRTTAPNRPDVIENLAKSIRNAPPKQDELSDVPVMDSDSLEIPDPDALGECRTFVIDKDGHAAASPGSHDDDVMGLAIAFYLIGSATVYTEKIVERKIQPWDYKVDGDDKNKPKGPMGI